MQQSGLPHGHTMTTLHVLVPAANWLAGPRCSCRDSTSDLGSRTALPAHQQRPNRWMDPHGTLPIQNDSRQQRQPQQTPLEGMPAGLGKVRDATGT